MKKKGPAPRRPGAVASRAASGVVAPLAVGVGAKSRKKMMQSFLSCRNLCIGSASVLVRAESQRPVYQMDFQAHEDFEDESLAAFNESAADDRTPHDWDGREAEITQDRPMMLRFAAEDADQLVVKLAEMRHLARFFLEDARAALSTQLCGLAPEAADVLRAQIAGLLDAMNAAFDGARGLEIVAVSALHEVCGDNFSFDAEEAALELCPPDAAPKIKLSVECQTLRRQFFAAAKKVGLITRGEVRAARLAAVAGFVGRALASTGELTQAEWNSVVYAVEDGRLQW